MALPDFPGVYVLGCFASHVTIYSQQVRALNLVDALCRTDELTPETRVVVVGGGAAGVTAAAAAAVRGARVTIVESDSNFFPIQRNAATRYLHPHIYDWPLNEDAGGRSGLPLLGWEAADAPVVFQRLKAAWDALWTGGRKDTRPQALMSTEFVGLEPDIRAGWLVQLRDADGVPSVRSAQIVVLALGFGREAESPTALKYWDASPIDSISSGRNKLSFLISGCGDGGLTDLMRLCIRDFRHDEYVERFARAEETAGQLKELLEVDTDSSETMEEAFERVYGSVPARVRIDRDELRKDLTVTFNAPRGYLEDARSSVLNRFIVFQLQKLGAFTLQEGRMKLPVPPPRPDGRTRVTFENGTDSAAVKKTFDRVVLRHGSVPALSKTRFAAFPPFAGAVERLRLSWAQQPKHSHDTRVPLWDSADYDPAAGLPALPPPVDADEADLRVFTLASSAPGSDGDLLELVELAGMSGRKDLRQALGWAESLPGPRLHHDGKRVDAALASPRAYDQTVALLCRADIAVIDVTGFEPGVMLFLGIRSAARRGVTVVTTRDSLGAETWARLPFNLRELFPLPLASGEDPERVLADALAAALRRSRSVPDYLDVPAYEAVRRHEAATENQPGRVLWLCSFAEGYRPCRDYLRLGFKAASGNAQGQHVPSALERITDAGTSQLVTQRLYTAIRSSNLCLVDWSLWSPNVFFELGVRLAVSPMGPVCVLEHGLTAGGLEERDGCECQAAQRAALIRLFRPIVYGEAGSREKLRLWEQIFARFDEMQAHRAAGTGRVRPSFGAFAYDHSYRLVGESVPLCHEAGALATDQVLSAAGDALLGESSTSDPSLPVLFAGVNPALDRQARAAGLEFVAAAWLYLRHRFTPAERTADAALHRRYADLSFRLLELLGRGGLGGTPLAGSVAAAIEEFERATIAGSDR